ncbi:MAG TPA: L,D-transpeptidase family protein [Candidatus Aquicultor sp.]|jgi:peptidoglycan hydrolase-like protein with peptidoglycan-binding domain
MNVPSSCSRLNNTRFIPLVAALTLFIIFWIKTPATAPSSPQPQSQTVAQPFASAPVNNIEAQTSASAPTTTPAKQKTLKLGMRGADVTALQRRLAQLHYSPGAADGNFGQHTYYAVVAFQKVNRLPQDGVIGTATAKALANPKTIAARYSDTRVEVNKALQILLVVKKGTVDTILTASTGKPGYTTPNIKSQVDWKPGYKFFSTEHGVWMYWSSFFYGGVAVHGYESVPPYPASHGCVRIPIADSKYVYDAMPVGSMVYVY